MIRIFKNKKNLRLTTLILLILYVAVGYFGLAWYVYKNAEERCIAQLEAGAALFVENFQQGAEHDREQLRIFSHMVVMALDEGDDKYLELLPHTYDHHGDISALEVLLPDGRLVTAHGTYDVSDQLSFAHEAALGEYISDRVEYIPFPDQYILRNAVPVVYKDETIAILYGIIELEASIDEFEAYTAFAGEAVYYVVEKDTGAYLLDTWRKTLSASDTARIPKKGYSMDTLREDFAAGREGYTAFESELRGETLYMYYMPVGINDWYAMVSVPERIAFADFHTSLGIIVLVGVYMVAGMLLYLFAFFSFENKRADRSRYTSDVKALLLEARKQTSYFREALGMVMARGDGKIAFLLCRASDGVDVVTVGNEKHCDSCRVFAIDLLREMIEYTEKNGHGGVLHLDKKTRAAYPFVAEFMEKQGLSNIVFAPALTSDGSTRDVLGVCAVKNTMDTREILDGLAYSFSMAIADINYVRRIKDESLIDALTGAVNRAGYHECVSRLKMRVPEHLACVYTDVNNLHSVNNMCGHAAGDRMLQTVAQELMDAFGKKNVYRIGGDEFVILLENLEEATIREKIAAVTAHLGQHTYSISVGLRMSQPGEIVDIDALIADAEQVMYEDKSRYYIERGTEKRR